MDVDRVERLKACQVLQGLGDAEIIRIASACTWRNLEPGEVLNAPGETVYALYTVTRGRLKMEHRENGRERFVGYVNRGETVGQASFLSHKFNQQIGYIAEIPSEIAVINRHRALRLIFEIPRFRDNLISGFGLRIQEIFSGKKLRRFPKIVGVVSNLDGIGRPFLPKLCRELSRCNEQLAVFSDREEEFEALSGAIEFAPVTDSDPSKLGKQIQQKLANANRVLVDVPMLNDATTIGTVVELCGEVLWCCDNEHRDLNHQTLLNDLLQHSPPLRARLAMVQLFANGNMTRHRTRCSTNLVQRDFLVPMAETSSDRLFQQGMDRIVRHLRGVKVGLALGGGGARGLSHLGVLRCLENAGISVDIMSGTSSGAMIGLGYAAGLSPNELIEAFMAELQPPTMLQNLPGGRRLFLFAKFRTRAWESMLRKYYHNWTFGQLPIPFSVAVTDLVSGGQIVRESGDIVNAILESINVPVMAEPILRDGQILVDGGVVNNLPIELLNDRGAEFVIAVDASKEIPMEFAGNVPGMNTSQMNRPGRLETAYRVMDVSRRGIAQLQMNLADIVIEPDTSAFDFADFTSAREIANQGEAAAEKALPQIVQLYDEMMNDQKS